MQAIESAIEGRAMNGCSHGMMSEGGIIARLVREARREEVELMVRNCMYEYAKVEDCIRQIDMRLTMV